MPLLTDDLRKRIPPIYSQEADEEPMFYACFVLPGTDRKWYVAEGGPQGDDYMFFGFVYELKDKFGYFLLSELEAVRSPLGLPVELDTTFIEGRLTDVVPAPEL
jgi:hypothetical protein